jgi:bifunctional non-homologous end joining protein LigD
MPGTQLATLEGRTFQVSHLDKILWPDGTTKAAVLAYYTAVAPALRPPVRGRAVTFLRIPAGATAV